jgi:hypothetical protein
MKKGSKTFQNPIRSELIKSCIRNIGIGLLRPFFVSEKKKGRLYGPSLSTAILADIFLEGRGVYARTPPPRARIMDVWMQITRGLDLTPRVNPRVAVIFFKVDSLVG